MEDISEIRLDKSKISVSNSFENTEEKKYWWSRTPEERLREVERLRRMTYGYKATERMQKVLEIVKYE